MRVSVPGLPQAILSASSTRKRISPSEATLRLTEFLGKGNVTVLTGAGVSVDSGIRAYRGDDGRYMNPNYKPIFYHELIDETEKGYSFRQRYWLRSYLGYPPVRDSLPNTTHFALAALQHTSIVPRLITQNVDGLHHKALRHAAGFDWGPSRLQHAILELHGTLHRVHCKFGHNVDRGLFQDWLSAANPECKEFADEMERTSTQPRTNPDGDNDFIIPDCPSCLVENRRNSIHKPEVIFFGESIPQHIKERSFRDVEASDRLLVIGTTLATYSAFRLLKHALELKKPVMMLNVGPSRADGSPGVEKIDMASGSIIRDVARAVLGTRAVEDPVVKNMLESGIVKPPPLDQDGV
ncbi:NAD-dependent protein deacylase SIR4 [Hypsizygus marmoreus]|uniref:NAD-dependent protein deacylase SIR4 n=1 Tax=Hypsizygus marmoreus TaxID=39966 RepID=A0A369JSI4_HYPMA|nr:NAD-dependent protein deacylase SIR4 [Hypsizygus marmoreus]